MPSQGFNKCDHRDCPARAASYFTRGTLSLAFCGHHSGAVSEEMRQQRFEKIIIPEESDERPKEP